MNTLCNPKRHLIENKACTGEKLLVESSDFELNRDKIWIWCKVFSAGSPLGIFLTLRKVNPLRGQGLGSREAAGLMVGEAAKHGDGLPAAQRMYNLYHPFDPVGFRWFSIISPALHTYFLCLKMVSRYDGLLWNPWVYAKFAWTFAQTSHPSNSCQGPISVVFHAIIILQCWKAGFTMRFEMQAGALDHSWCGKATASLCIYRKGQSDYWGWSHSKLLLILVYLASRPPFIS